jgi:hypothetical protein
VRRHLIVTLSAALLGATVLTVLPVGLPSAQGEGEPTLSISTTEGLTGTEIGVTGNGCYLPDGVTGADGLLFQLIAPDGSAGASETLLVERDGTWDTSFVVPAGVPAGEYAVRGTCIAPMYENLGIVTAGTFTVTGEGAAAPAAVEQRAPDTPRFPEQIEPYPAYDGQSTCSPSAKPGMVAFRDMVLQAYPASGSYGISRDCNVGGTSEHKEGRAWDWANDASRPADRQRVQNFMAWLFATDQYGHTHAMARRLGIMYIIWNRRIFRLYRASEGWTPYSGSSPHTDHVHISLTRAGGNKRTSFWTMQLDGPPGQPPPTNNRGPTAQFQAADRSIAEDYDFAEIGDFDGNGRQDLLWAGQGPKPDAVWWGRIGRGFVQTTVPATGRRPVVGDFDGDRRTDILWYTPGEGADVLWYGRADRTWDTKPVNIAARYARSMTGDYDGDGRDDIFWYGPGGNPDRMWFGRSDRHFVNKVVEIAGDYRAVSGDFDGDHRADVLWYAPGDATDFLYFGQPDRTFGVTTRTIAFDARPLVGDYNADGRDDLIWYVAGDGADKLWWSRANRSFQPGGVSNVTASYSPIATGDLDEDHKDDVVWFSGGGTSTIWWSKPK